MQMLADSRQAVAEIAPHPVKSIGISPLERINRLLLVADHEQSSGYIGPCAFTAGESLHQAFDHVPLGGAGVLGLIDKDMINAPVKAEQYPLGHGRIGQKVTGAQDQIVKIEIAQGLFSAGIVSNKALGEV